MNDDESTVESQAPALRFVARLCAGLLRFRLRTALVAIALLALITAHFVQERRGAEREAALRAERDAAVLELGKRVALDDLDAATWELQKRYAQLAR